jgi:hypothetical protein
MTDLERAGEQIAFARGYSLRLIDSIDPADWFRIPSAGVSHIGWQIGHLAFAEYRLVLARVRGPKPGDDQLISEEFTRLFGARSTPDADASRYPGPAAIRATLDRVHAQVLTELPRFDAAALAAPMESPHAIAKTKMESLFWCAAHELVHAGQIGLLRRQLGKEPLW